MSENSKSRIDHLIQPSALDGKHLVVVGLGSGGYPVVQHLAMCGLKNWTLVDKDTLDEENLEKHPAMREDIGKLKTKIAKDWILDRNPSAQVNCLDIDVTTAEGKKELAAVIENADAVLCCTDNKNSRIQVNRICLKNSTPCVTGLIYRTGFGGDSFLYDPGKTACYDCFLDQAQDVSIERMMNSSKSTSDVEETLAEARYGRAADPKYGLSGLSIDIQFISLLMSRMLLPVLLNVPVDEEFRMMMADSNNQIASRETHLLRIPYDYRGPKPPNSADEKTVWLNTEDGHRYGMMPKCGNCGSVVTPEHDKFCSWCGSELPYEDEIPDNGNTITREWRPIPPPKDGHGYNHLVFISRRHLIDEMELDEDGVPKGTGNIHIALQPLTIQKNFVGRLKTCKWC